MKRVYDTTKSNGLLRYVLLVILFLGLGTMIYFIVSDSKRKVVDPYAEEIYVPVQPEESPKAVTISPDTLSKNNLIGELQELLLQKDDTIMAYKMQLSALKNELSAQNTFLPVMPVGPAESKAEQEAVLREREELQMQLEAATNQIPGLKYAINTLEKENEQLKARLNARSDAGVGSANIEPVKRRTDQLEMRVKELTAQLSFEQIDCNLTRADVNSIISNSRQRKELLAAALSALNQLTKSEEPAVRLKAKEQFLRLEAIAKTVRD